MLVFVVFLRESARTAAKSRTNLSTNSGKSYQTAGPIGTKFGKHVQIHMGKDIRQTNCPSRHKGGTWGVLGGQQFKSIAKLSDWHQIWFRSADSSGNGHRLNKSRPSIPQGALGGGGGSWYTSADSSGNGHRLNTIRPTIPQGHFGFFRGSQIQMFGEPVKIWYKSADSSGSGHELNTIGPSIPQWVLGGITNSKVWVSCQTTGLIGTQFGKRLRIRLGLDIG